MSSGLDLLIFCGTASPGAAQAHQVAHPARQSLAYRSKSSLCCPPCLVGGLGDRFFPDDAHSDDLCP
jgi:hypothetical protein